MTSLKYDEESIFTAARVITDAAARADYLREACGSDDALRRRIEGLLAVHDGPDRLLDRPAVPTPVGDETRTSPGEANPREDLAFLEPSDKPDSLGRLGHYEVQEVVGRGGMGVVLRAFDEKLHRVVAIKVMAPQLAAGATARRRFTREARAAAAVTHNHVVTIHAVEESAPLPYIVMQFVAGISLQDRLDRTGPLQLHEILRIGMQTASGLAAAHAQELVHRDVKPANILLENGVERVKLTDFGLARAADDASLTQSGVIAGTPSFMSPEQAEGKPVDHRSDLFSLGSVLYAMCAGIPPFRGSSTPAVLRRVVEDTPKPLREANPEVPDWLAAVVERLHGKDPATRFQSAAEVAELLGRHLAHVQHPSVVPLPSHVPSLAPPARAVGTLGKRRHRWAAAATVLLAVAGAFGAAEATGVTNLRATVVRIFTPEGTLVVETDDPAVKVTVEGDGDLVITGAGPQEVRLRQGSYRLRATKDGKPVKLDRDLVAISRGDKQVVRVRLEGTPAVGILPTAERGAFVLLVGKGAAERRFDTLAEAVISAADGDTVEVRGNGPFASEPITIRRTALTIRAGEGFRPIIRVAHPGQQNLLITDEFLTLEGLELQNMVPDALEPLIPWRDLVSHRAAPLYVANCRFLSKNLADAVTFRSAACEIRNCEFLGIGRWALVANLQSRQRLKIENCLLAGAGFVCTFGGDLEKESAFVRLTRNTCLTESSGAFGFSLHRLARAKQLLELEASGNVFDAHPVVGFYQFQSGKILPPLDAKAFLRQLVVFSGQRNLYAGSGPFLHIMSSQEPDQDIKTFADWKNYWGSPEAHSTEGRLRYRGGDLLEKLRVTPEKLTPEDFRLRPDSPGYRPGDDGKDLGADVDLVGPGAAYERWKKTPDYQKWLKDTGQVKK